VKPQRLLDDARDRFGLLAVYLFGSRADDGRRLLAGQPVEPAGSDLDIGIVYREGNIDFASLGRIHLCFQEIFEPLAVDLVPLQQVDPLFQFRAIDGHRVTVSDSHRADLFELEVMSRAAELLPVQRQLERELFGVATS
jgi:predicted nucleotidyltransferase